ncbi:MAG: HK97 gp10 family phage protein [Candidatus Binataceae bacterium]|nr:HK97 gp10 family phage protein [Candidatus Binataceae bacterium]
MITVELIGDRALIARLDAIPTRERHELARAVTKLALKLQRKVQRKLSGQVLKVRTGTLRSSINTETRTSESEVTATVGTNVKYGRFQEFGVSHAWLIEARNARSLRFEIGGRTIFRRSVRHPPLPERSFLRSALAEMRPQIEAGLTAAVDAALKE